MSDYFKMVVDVKRYYCDECGDPVGFVLQSAPEFWICCTRCSEQQRTEEL